MDAHRPDFARLAFYGLLGLAAFGVVVVVLAPAEDPAAPPRTPPPTPEQATLWCLDGRAFRSIDALARPGLPDPDGRTPRAHWTLTFDAGGYVLDQAGVREAGPYRCDGARIVASGPHGVHRALHASSDGRLAWDALGFERADAAPRTTGSGG